MMLAALDVAPRAEIAEAVVDWDDDTLIDHCLRGRQDAWETLLQRYGRLIYSIPYRYGMNAEEAADVYQSVCLTLLERLGTLRNRERLSSWLITTTARECWAAGRRRRKYVGTGGQTAPEEEEVDQGPLPEELAVRWEQQHHVRRAIRQLPPRCQQLLWYLFYDRSHPSYVEVGRRLGIPTPSIGPTRARCLEKLKTTLERMEIDLDHG